MFKARNDKKDRIADFAKYPELRWLDRWHFVPVLVFTAGGLPVLIWGFFVSTVLLWHTTFLVNSACHLWGWRRYPTSDTSRNNTFLALITLGEGWHNNHHHYMASARQGFFWWEIDFGYYLIWLLKLCRLIWDVREVPQQYK